MSIRPTPTPLPLEQFTDVRVGIVQACFNEHITNQQFAESQRCLQEYAIPYDQFRVSGCYEIIYALQNMIKSKKYDALVAIGCLIKGETMHFEVISSAVSQAIMDLIRTQHIPIGFGIITAYTEEQAQARTWIGYDATYAVLDTLYQMRPYNQFL